MAELLPLDKAAALVGKSEVTVRRLIKAGRIPFQKEKTLTGFVYRVDPAQIQAYYKVREGTLLAEEFKEQTEEAPKEAEKKAEPVAKEVKEEPAQKVRVAIAGESGDLYEYWQKKSDLYEDKYNQEVSKHSHTREELGVWRGRAEQAQSMLMKMLPSGDVEVKSTVTDASVQTTEKSSMTGIVVVTTVVVVLLIIGFVYIYLRLPH